MNGIVVGAGIGGLSTAIALRERFIDVRVYEAADELSPVGAGILVPPNAMLILDRYGLAGKVRKAGVRLDSLSVFDSKGRIISDTPARHSKDGCEYQTIAIHRGALQSIFLQSLPSAAVITGKRCSHLKTEAEGADVFFEDGTSTHGRFVVGADGLRSKVRESIFADAKLRYSGQVCWRGVSEISLGPKWRSSLSEMWGAGIRFGFVPINDSRVYWYATKREQAGGIDDAATIKKTLLGLYDEFPDPIPDVILQTDSASIIRDDINDLSPMKRWFLKSTVLIGDAAHASTPNLGQGGAQAIEDSWVLAKMISEHALPQKAFARFQAQRYSRVRKIVNISRQIGKVTNLKNKTACKVRDTLIRNVPKFMAKHQSRIVYDVSY